VATELAIVCLLLSRSQTLGSSYEADLNRLVAERGPSFCAGTLGGEVDVEFVHVLRACGRRWSIRVRSGTTIFRPVHQCARRAMPGGGKLTIGDGK